MRKTAARRWMFGALVALGALVLAGCAVTPETRAKTAPGAVRLAPGEGLLALKITSNRALVSTFFSKWTTLRVRQVDGKESFTLVDKSDSSAGHALFVGALPAGTYAIDAVGNEASGYLTITENAKAAGAFANFRVAAGQMTDLGTLTYVRRHFPVDSRQFRWGQAESPFDRAAVLRQLEPTLAAQLNAQPILGWNEGAEARDRHATQAASLRMTMRAQSPTPLPDGGLMFGESFGQIAVRKGRDDWQWLQTPTSLPIRALHATPDGTLFAGSDDGVLLVRPGGAAAWEAVPLPGGDASVLHVGSLPGSEDLLVVLQTRDRFLGLSTSAKAPGTWTEQFARPRALFANRAQDAHGAVLRSGERLVFVSGSPEARLDVTSWDAAAKRWTSTTLGESGLPFGWSPMPGGAIGRFQGIPLTGMYFAASSDDGRTWERRGDLNWTNGSLLFTRDGTGYVVRTDSIPAFDAEKFELSIWRTTDAGRQWTKVGRAPAVHGRLVDLGAPQALGYASANGKFFVSADGGLTWMLERELP